MSDWEQSDDEPTKVAPTPAPVVLPRKSRFADEDVEQKAESDDDWDASSADEATKKAASAAAVPAVAPRKKGNLKAKLAEKAAQEEERKKAILAGKIEDVGLELTPQERRRLEKQQEIEADLANAADLLGAASVEDKSISSLLEIKCKTKEDFAAFSQQLYTLLIERHTSNPLFSSFVEQHVKDVCETLKDSEVRKAASGLSILANTKQQEQRDAKSGKKKVTKAKPILGGGKSTVQTDTNAYEDALDDGDDDFM